MSTYPRRQWGSRPNPELPRCTHLVMPGASFTNIAYSNSQPTLTSATTSETAARVATELGFGHTLHPFGGSNGTGSVRYPVGDGISSDVTFFWFGLPSNSSSANGWCATRGNDTAGTGWSVALRFVDSNAVRFSIVTSAPVAYDASLTGQTFSSTTLERIAGVRKGTQLSVYRWAGRGKASATTTTVGLRNSSAGVYLGASNASTTSGHNVCTLFSAFNSGFEDDLVWSVLADPRLLFEPRRIWVPVTAAPTGPTVTALLRQRSQFIGSGLR